MTDPTTPPTRRSRAPRARRRVSVTGVIGELLITAGVVAMLFVAWQLWIGDVIYAQERAVIAREQSVQWQEQYEEQSPEAAESLPPETLPSLPQPADGEVFGTMYVPRWGADYAMSIAGGVTRAVTLDPIGIGHYTDTPMPGEPGNVGLAGHRTTFGKPFNRIADLHIGDAVVIETVDGWYTYRFRNLQYVVPKASDVLLPVPQQPEVAIAESFLTLTSCSPMYSLAERIIGYTVFESFTPRADGKPASLTEGIS